MKRAFDVTPRAGKSVRVLLPMLIIVLYACGPVRPVPEGASTPPGEQSAAPVAAAATEAPTSTPISTPTSAPEPTAVPTATPTPESTVAPTAVPTAVPTLVPTLAPTAAPTPDPALMAAGLAVYRAQYCGVCHRLTAAATMGTFGPPHDGLAAAAAARIVAEGYSGAATTPAEYIYESIVSPEVYVVPDYLMTSHRMPSYGHVPAGDLTALVAFLAAQ
jgi:mono/diheme cytochrome c family protein